MIEIVGDAYRIWSHHAIPTDQVEDGNIDVFVDVDGDEYTFTVFTVENIVAIMDRHQRSGENLSGMFLGGNGMMIVKIISEDVLNTIVRHLVETKSYASILERLEPDDDSRHDSGA